MDVKKSKVIALVGDSLHDIENVHLISKTLSELGANNMLYTDIDDNVMLNSVVLILNGKSEYRTDANTFIHSIIDKHIPIIVIYSEINDNKDIHDSTCFTEYVSKLWELVPAFSEELFVVPTVHILSCDLRQIIKSNDFAKGTMLDPSDYYLLNKDDK